MGGHYCGPARVVVNAFDGRGVDSESFKSKRAMIEYYISERLLYEGEYDDEKLIAWLESLKGRIDASVASLRASARRDAASSARCGQCDENPAGPVHSCPYLVENDEDCEKECKNDV